MSDAPGSQFLPSPIQPLMFDAWGGLNTEPSRPSIEDAQASWLDGFMPIGRGNVRTMPGVGRTIFTAPAGTSVVLFWFGNIAATPYCLVFLSDGSFWVTPTNAGGQTRIAPPGTIINPSLNAIGVTQWGAERFIIVADQPNGYWIWDGTLFTAGGLAPEVIVTDGGTGYSSAPVIATSGGSGSGAIFQAFVSGGVIIAIGIVSPGTGWLAGDTVTLAISDTTGTGATATISLMPFGIQGTAVETYQNRVWVFDGPLCNFTSPQSFDDFTTANGGGSFTSSDSFLRRAYIQAVQTNGFLYLIGDSSVNYISGVQTAGDPPTTTFTNQNVNPEVGSPWPWAVGTVNGNIIVSNAFGVHIASGSTVTKVSEPLDGIYNTVPNFGGFQPSAAKHTLFGKKIWALLQRVEDRNVAEQTYCTEAVSFSDATPLRTHGGLLNTPASFATALFGAWVFLPDNNFPHGVSFGNQIDPTGNFPNPGMVIGIVNDQTAPGAMQITVRVYPTVPVSATWFNLSNQLVTWLNNSSQVVPWSVPIVEANYAYGAWSGWVWVGVSIDTTTQQIQVFVNDTELAPSSLVWTSRGAIPNPPATPWMVTPPAGATTTMADLWFSPTDGFIDLSDDANRRMFVTCLGGTALLGGDGSAVTGDTPPVFLTVTPGGDPWLFGLNYGNGGPFEPVWITADGFTTIWRDNAGDTAHWLGAGMTADTIELAGTNPPCGISLADGPLGTQILNKLFLWDGKRWWSSNQDRDLIFIGQQEIDSVITAAGTDGTDIFYLMQTPSCSFAKVAQSRLWPIAIGYQVLKSANRLWGIVDYKSLDTPEIQVTIDTERGQEPTTINLGPIGSDVTWLNAARQVVPWTNSGGDVVHWMGTGASVSVFPPQVANGIGALMGMTVRTLAADVVLISMAIDQSVVQYRG